MFDPAVPTGKPAPISCYIRTLNEERLIDRVLKAALAAAEDVVIVDCGSTDRTKDIALGLGVRVIEQPWLGNGRQKRVGEDACRHDWLLDLDADEVLTAEVAAEIRDLFRAGPPAHAIYEIDMVTMPPVGRPWWNFRLVPRRKLYDRRVVRIPDHAAWDQFEVPSGATVGRLKGRILHYSFKSIAHMVEKYNRVSSARVRDGRPRSLASSAFRVWFAFPVYFFKAYVSRGLFRAGTYGLIAGFASAYARWLRDAKMYEAAWHAREKKAAAKQGDDRP